MRRFVLVLTIATLLGVTSISWATLWDRGNGMIYDDHLNITWLQEANYAATQYAASVGSQGDAVGLMNWNQADTWAKNLVYGGYDDWRLPSTVDGQWIFGYDGTTTAGYNITSSELGYMYYVNLGNKGWYDANGNMYNPQSDTGLKNTSFTDGNGNTVSFLNARPSAYWSGTEYGKNRSYAWFFRGRDGSQDAYFRKDSNYFYAWAVRSVGAPVPIPAAAWLFGSGLIGLAGLRRKFFK